MFLAGAAVSLGASWILVGRLERVAARFGVSEGLLGMVAALAADAPEITAAVTALIAHQTRIGAGVAIGSNLFNLAALLGLAALVAGRIELHRRVVVLDGTIAIWTSGLGLLTVVGVLAPAVALGLLLLLFIPYLFALSARRRMLEQIGLPASWVGWVEGAVEEAEVELQEAIHPTRGGRRDIAEAVLATLVVVGASVVMERAASMFGRRHGMPEIIVGGLILAAVTSLPNAVAGIYLAARGRGAATLSTSLNSNGINIAAGLLLPGTILGVGASNGPGTLVAACNVGLTATVLSAAYRGHGLRRGTGALIVAGYLAFVVALLAVS